MNKLFYIVFGTLLIIASGITYVVSESSTDQPQEQQTQTADPGLRIN